MARNRFPVLAVILLVFAIAWLFNELGYFHIDLPWLPIILVFIAVGMIVNRYNR